MNQNFGLRFHPAENVSLQSIGARDRADLREWKNANRFAFFYQGIITPEMQAAWFEKYLTRTDDYMFIVLYRGEAIGCMGFRLLGMKADIYNVILGRANAGGKGLMTQALRLMCSFIAAEFTREIRLDVLKSNPAIDWYRSNGFVQTDEFEKHFELTLEVAHFDPCAYERVDLQSPSEEVI